MMKAIAATLGIGLILGGCGAQPDSTAPANATTVLPSGPMSVDVVPVKSAMLATTVAIPAQFKPEESVDLAAKVPAFIESISVDRGSPVRRGQVLVRLSAPEIAAQQAQASAQLRAASAKASADSATYGRLANAAKSPGVVAENDVDIARNTAAASAAQARSAASAVSAAREMSGYLVIPAPFDGIVTARNLHPGAIVGPTSGAPAILQIAKSQRLRLEIAVPANDVQSAKPGTVLTFTTPAMPGKTFSVKISRMAGAVDPATRTMMVEADVSAQPGLAAGSFASVRWPIARSYPTLRVPPTAIANDQQRQFVIRVRGGVAQWVDVTTGRNADGRVEVFGDLREGDLVVQRGTDAIKDGAPVKPVQKPSSSAKP